MPRVVSRRSVVKLVYAAPVIAATMSLRQTGVLSAALCNSQCSVSPRNPDCDSPHGIVCAAGERPVFCSDAGGCVLIDTIEGDICCVSQFDCGPACGSTDDCQAWMTGSLCQAPDTGCCGQVCIPPCGHFPDGNCTPPCQPNLP